ncbi:hypothetical protein LINPERHAP2_LOCUS33990 [Linum perenne]
MECLRVEFLLSDQEKAGTVTQAEILRLLDKVIVVGREHGDTQTIGWVGSFIKERGSMNWVGAASGSVPPIFPEEFALQLDSFSCRRRGKEKKRDRYYAIGVIPEPRAVNRTAAATQRSRKKDCTDSAAL